MLILLAEDSKTLAQALRRKLEGMGHEVAHAMDGQAALDWYATGHPDLVVMDIEMPRMDGFEAARRIRALESKRGDAAEWTPIVFLTATDTVQNLLAAIEAGGDDFLPKTAPDQVLGAKIGAMARISALMQKVKKLSHENKALAKEAGTDAMTTLPNRRALDNFLDKIDKRDARQSKRGLSIMMIDVDHFKNFNDMLGHAAGDDCLERVGSELAALVEDMPAGAFAARYGGEEFVVVLDGGSREEAMACAWSICAGIEGLAIAHPSPASKGVVSVSIGVSGRKLGQTSREVVKEADLALYEAKKSGRAQAVWRTAVDRDVDAFEDDQDESGRDD
jgi:diguanylate cyclase (GGDEF)-like protein